LPKPVQTDFITIRGRAQYARVLGAPMDNYDKDGKEWKIDIVIDDAKDIKRLKALGIGDRVKQKEEYLDGAPHMTLRQKAEKKDGTPADPPEVVDLMGKPWNDKKAIGNGSIIDIKIRVADYGKGFKKGMYINGVRVLEHVPYTKNAFEELDKDDPYFKKANDMAARQASENDDDAEEEAPEGNETEVDEEDIPFD
jgi:hypothetical protein